MAEPAPPPYSSSGLPAPAVIVITQEEAKKMVDDATAQVRREMLSQERDLFQKLRDLRENENPWTKEQWRNALTAFSAFLVSATFIGFHVAASIVAEPSEKCQNAYGYNTAFIVINSILCVTNLAAHYAVHKGYENAPAQLSCLIFSLIVFYIVYVSIWFSNGMGDCIENELLLGILCAEVVLGFIYIFALALGVCAGCCVCCGTMCSD